MQGQEQQYLLQAVKGQGCPVPCALTSLGLRGGPDEQAAAAAAERRQWGNGRRLAMSGRSMLLFKLRCLMVSSMAASPALPQAVQPTCSPLPGSPSRPAMVLTAAVTTLKAMHDEQMQE